MIGFRIGVLRGRNVTVVFRKHERSALVGTSGVVRGVASSSRSAEVTLASGNRPEAEVVGVGDGELTMRPTGEADALLLRTNREIVPSNAHEVVRGGDGTLVTSRTRGNGEGFLAIAWTD